MRSIHSLHSKVLWLASFIVLGATSAMAQEIVTPTDGLPTIMSVKASAGWGLGRSQQLYGKNGPDEVWWSTGNGAKMNLALDLPLITMNVMDSLGSASGMVPVVGLELEAATGYDFSSGGTTNDETPGGAFQTTTRTASYIPVTLGLNARTNFGGGLPSVYVGAGGGVYLIGIYQEDVNYSDNPSAGFTRKMHPPVPFGLYGAIGFELPLMYDPNDGNSMFDLYTEVRLTEMSTYVYDYDITGSTSATGGATTLAPQADPTMLYLKDSQRSASNVALTIGIKFNVY
jgi:hypothetical protein